MNKILIFIGELIKNKTDGSFSSGKFGALMITGALTFLMILDGLVAIITRSQPVIMPYIKDMIVPIVSSIVMYMTATVKEAFLAGITTIKGS